MEFETLESLRARHPAWRLLRVPQHPLALWFLGRHFVEDNNGATPASALVSRLDYALYSLRDAERADGNRGDDEPTERRFAREPSAYLDEWAAAGWLRRFYPLGSDEVHYDALPPLERAYAWVISLQARSFVGTESRLHTVVELLRQIVQGSEPDPQARLADLHRRRAEIDAQIARVESGDVPLLDSSALRDRYQQFAATARELLSDFREVEENFRALDRSARERIAGWEGAKGELLTDLVGNRTDIASSDQGRSFQAFYDFLLSEQRQEELSSLLAQVDELTELTRDRRLRTIHHDWAEAAERTQQTVRQISEQLRRFLDDQVWLENRRVVELARQIESAALELREDPPPLQLELDEPGIHLALPFERPLYDARPPARVDSLLDPTSDSDVDVSALFGQQFVDAGRLAENVRSLVPPRGSALLTDIIGLYPLQQGVAELVGYLALDADDIEVSLDDTDQTHVDLADGDTVRRVRMPKATVTRR